MRSQRNLAFVFCVVFLIVSTLMHNARFFRLSLGNESLESFIIGLWVKANPNSSTPSLNFLDIRDKNTVEFSVTFPKETTFFRKTYTLTNGMLRFAEPSRFIFSFTLSQWGNSFLYVNGEKYVRAISPPWEALVVTLFVLLGSALLSGMPPKNNYTEGENSLEQISVGRHLINLSVMGLGIISSFLFYGWCLSYNLREPWFTIYLLELILFLFLIFLKGSSNGSFFQRKSIHLFLWGFCFSVFLFTVRLVLFLWTQNL